MKKSISLLLLLMMAFGSFAQDSGSSFHFGLKAAPSLAWLKVDDGLEGNGSKIGFTYGLITEFNFSDRYAFATGLDVTYRGGKVKSQDIIKNVNQTDSLTRFGEANYTLQYIELPITLKLKTNEIGYLTYYLQAGLTPGINIRARANTKVYYEKPANATHPTPNPSEGDDVDVKDGINSLNLSMVIGGGIEYTLSGSTVLLAGIEFNNGFVDVIDGNGKANSNFLALKLGVLF